MFEQDDVENWVSITTLAGGSMAKRLLLNSRMGLRSDDKPVTEPLADFHGPGTAYVGYGEYNQRGLLSAWADCLERPLIDLEKIVIGSNAGMSRRMDGNQ